MQLRLEYMEKILQRHVGSRELSLQTLEEMAADDQALSHCSTEDGDGGVVNETYDLKVFENNAARSCQNADRSLRDHEH